MAVMLVSTFTQYIGTSSDVKPNVGTVMPDGTRLTRSDLMPGAKFLESDTGILWTYDGSSWQRTLPDAVSALFLQSVTENIQALHRTLEMLRQGLINVGNCDDVNPADVSLTPAELAF